MTAGFMFIAEKQALRIRIGKQTGLFEQIYVEGEELLDCPMELNIWRAPTDNDKLIKLKWLKARYDQSYARAYETAGNAMERISVLPVRWQ